METSDQKSCQSIVAQSHVVPVHIVKAYKEVEAQVH